MKIAQGKYSVLSSLGYSESFVKLARSKDMKKRLALKLEDAEKESLHNEYQTMANLRGIVGVPEVYDFGQEAHYSYMTFELLGESLHQHRSGRDLSFLIAMMYQAIDTLKQIHKAGYVHGNLKPRHFLVGKGKKVNFLYLVDFSLANRYDSDELVSQDIVKDVDCLFCSLNLSFRGKCRPRDDLEALCYCLIWLYRRTLPWIPQDKKYIQPHIIKNFKLAVNLSQICKDCPGEILQILSYCRSLNHSDSISYKSIKKILKNLSQRISNEISSPPCTVSDMLKYTKLRKYSSTGKKSSLKLPTYQPQKFTTLGILKMPCLYSTNLSTNYSQESHQSTPRNIKYHFDFENSYSGSSCGTPRSRYPEVSLFLRKSIQELKMCKYSGM
jgi:tRNA A-37 threonylcarbamoyl transferase component Bud32